MSSLFNCTSSVSENIVTKPEVGGGGGSRTHPRMIGAQPYLTPLASRRFVDSLCHSIPNLEVRSRFRHDLVVLLLVFGLFSLSCLPRGGCGVDQSHHRDVRDKGNRMNPPCQGRRNPDCCENEDECEVKPLPELAAHGAILQHLGGILVPTCLGTRNMVCHSHVSAVAALLVQVVTLPDPLLYVAVQSEPSPTGLSCLVFCHVGQEGFEPPMYLTSQGYGLLASSSLHTDPCGHLGVSLALV